MTGAKLLTMRRSPSPRKKIRKRHAHTPSPERVVTDIRKSPKKKKKRCIKPIWSTTRHVEDTEELSETSDDEIVGVRMVSVKDEPSQEGNLVPYTIKPMVDLPSVIKKRKSDPKKRPEKHVSVVLSPIRAPVSYSPIRARTPSPIRSAHSPPPSPPRTNPARPALDIPVLGLSTYRVKGRRLINQAVNASLQHGYRLFDTGAHYQNQKDLGYAFQEYLPQHNLTREDIYIITKLDPGCLSYEDAMESAERSLQHLQTDYVDIILLYWPEPHYSMEIEPANAMLECYRALEDLHSAGKIKDIGAYKFSEDQLEYLLRRCAVVPAMLQAEFHPYLYRKRLVDICRDNSIRMQGFCFIKCVEDPVIISLARKYRKAPAQIILRWIIQHGVGVLPKSKTPCHIKENANVFDFSLSPKDMEWINTLNQDRSFTPYSVQYKR